MERDNQLPVRSGDWVIGKTKHGELIRGFVESTDALQGTVRVVVVACDNERTVGRTVETLNSWVKRLPEENPDDAGQLMSLIDVALAAGDRSWFMELTTRLNQLAKEEKETARRKPPFSPINRFGKFGITD